jgi:hypothetical protein
MKMNKRLRRIAVKKRYVYALYAFGVARMSIFSIEDMVKWEKDV